MERSRPHSSEERGAETRMDQYLRSIGLQRSRVAKDGSCLFRAVAEQVLHCQNLHTKVRAQCVDFLRENRRAYEAFIEGDFEDYLDKLQDPQQWVGEVEINALAVMYKRDFLIFQEPGRPAVNITDKNYKDQVRLCFLNGNHYDSVYPMSRVKNSAMCQSILYELLYDNVFKVDRSFLGGCQRAGRATDFLSDDSMAACVSSDESGLDDDEPLWIENGMTTRHTRGRGRGRHLPERVRRSLNPTLFRNIQYDVWHKTKRAQQKLDYRIAAGLQFTVGDRCQVRLDGNGRGYSAVVKEAPPDSSSVTVYIEELGHKQVPVWSLRPPADENSWSTVVNRDKRLSNGHGDWEGRGRGRAKHVSSPSVPQMTVTAGPGGRVVKQHSWPPQAGAEEGPGTRSTRKSTSSEAACGLMDQQCLAKEAEQRNVALVEIQLRDELSFPALAVNAQSDGGKKKSGEKRRVHRSKTKSPVEDVRAVSPSAGEAKSSTPPLPDTAAANAPPPPDALPPPDVAAPPSAAVAPPPVAVALPPARTMTSTLPAALPAATSKTNAPSSTSGAPPASPPASVATSAKPPSIPSSASLLSFLTPALPAASPPTLPSSSSSPPAPPTTAASPPPSSSLPPPTFIAPIAPSPTTALTFLPRSSSPSGSSQFRSPTPPSSSSSVVLHAPMSAAGSAVTSSSSTGQNQTSVSLQKDPQSHTEVCPPDLRPPHPQVHVSVSYLPQAHSEPVHVSSSHPPPPGASHPLAPQASLPSSIPHPHHQPPHPSQVPHPSLSTSPTANAQGRPEDQCAQPPPNSPLTHPPHHPHVPSVPPPQSAPPPPSIPGGVPLQQLSQLYQDPLYPGFPQGERGDMAPTPLMSSKKSGDDLPHDVNILRFFFNLGVKAYSMPMFPPYIYLLPLQQAHTLQPKLPSRSPSPVPHYPLPNPPTGHQEAYPHPQYPPASASLPPHYEHQVPLAETRPPSEPSYSRAGYPCPSLSWQQPQMPLPRNPGFSVGFAAPSLPYPVQQGYQVSGHPMYAPPVSLYPPSSLGYQSSPAHEDLQANQGPMEPRQPTNGDIVPGQALGRVPAAPATVANANNNNRPVVPGFALKKEQADGLNRSVLLVDPPLQNNPILVSCPVVKDASVSTATIKTSSNPGSPSPYEHHIISKTVVLGDNNNPSSRGYHGHQKVHPGGTYVPVAAGAQEPGQVVYMMTAMGDNLSIACSTEDDLEEQVGFKPSSLNQRGPRRGRGGGGGRGRGGGANDGGRGGHRRRHIVEGGVGYSYTQYNSSYRGRGRERGY